MKPRSCNNWLPAGKGYGVASASRLSWMRSPTGSSEEEDEERGNLVCFLPYGTQFSGFWAVTIVQP